jgi:hypothetical protein
MIKISKTQLEALRRYSEATMDGTAPLLTGRHGSVRSGTHCSLMRLGLLEVAVLRPDRTEQHTYGYNFGRNRITRSHLVCDSRFRLTEAGLVILGQLAAPCRYSESAEASASPNLYSEATMSAKVIATLAKLRRVVRLAKRCEVRR